MSFTEVLKQKYKINLSDQQEKAVNTIEGPCLLLSVPGGGKTTVIVSRCANMILNYKIDPKKIMTLTFSRASAYDMKSRFDRIFGNEVHSQVEFSTIHSFCYSVISEYVRKHNKPFPTVLEGGDAKTNKSQILKQIFKDINNEYISEDKLEELSNTISYVKNMLLSEEEIAVSNFSIENFSEIFKNYEKRKRESRLIDYDDMLTGTHQLFKQDSEMLQRFRNRYDYVNVDESQDTSLVQHELIKQIVAPKNNIFMVGDEDQSIYAFRAAFPKALIDFEKTYPSAKILLMERNYRSTKNIVSAANLFIKQNKERYEKNMFTEKGDGEPINYKHLDEKNEMYDYLVSNLKKAQQLPECAILFRNNISAIPVIDYFERSGIKFYLRESNVFFFNHWIFLDIKAFVQLATNPGDIRAFGQIYYKLDGFINKNMYEYVCENIKSEKSVIETLMCYPQMHEKLRQSLQRIEKYLKQLPSIKPLTAIEFIENYLDYRKYLRRASGEKGYTPEGLNQILDTVKIIASKTNSFDELFLRMDVLQKSIEESSKQRHENAVVLTTIHSSKGLEFDNVYIIDLIEGQFPSSKSISEFEEGETALMEEEVRLFYVGITRAKKHLEIITYDKANKRKVHTSRFVESLLGTNKEDSQKYLKQKSDILAAKSDEEPKILRQFSKKIDAEDVRIGVVIEHIAFGEGEIVSLDDTMSFMEVDFKMSGVKKLSLKLCVGSRLIRRLI